MDFKTEFDLFGNSFISDLHSGNGLLSTSFSNASGHEFSNPPSFPPLKGDTEMTVADISVCNSQQFALDMLEYYNKGSEFPFPKVTADSFTSPYVDVNTVAPATLALGLYSNATAIPRQNFEPQSIDVQAIEETEAKYTRRAGRKMTLVAMSKIDAGEEPSQKRKRGVGRTCRTKVDLATRREDYLQRNKVAARKYRQRRKIMEAQMEERLSQEAKNNYVTWNGITSVYDELESVCNIAVWIESHCQSAAHKIAVSDCLERIMTVAAELQNVADKCNRRRSEIV